MKLSVNLSKLEGGEVVDSNTYQSMIRSLRYLTCIMSDIPFIMKVASRFMDEPKISSLESGEGNFHICQYD
jgi:hypothetical protein